jgi:hypothetical protein
MRTHGFVCCGIAIGLLACGDDGERCHPDVPNTICTIAGTGEAGAPSFTPVPAKEASLSIPFDLAMASDGTLWVIDFNNYVVRAIDAGGMITTVIGNGDVGDCPDHTPALEAPFSHVTDLRFHDGYLYLASWHNSRIKRVRLSDMMVENFAGRGARTHYDGDGGPAIDAALDLPAALAVRGDGAIVVMDQANQVVRAIDPAGVINTILGKCIADVEAPCAPGQPLMTCPGSSKLVCRSDPFACVSPCAPDYAGDGGAPLDVRMAQPFGDAADPGGHIAYDRGGNLLFADTNNHRIRKIDTAGVVSTIAGIGGTGKYGAGGYSGDGGPATSALLNGPVDLAVADDGTIYFTDVYNSCVRKIDPAGVISTAVGTCGVRGYAGDGGPPAQATLARPFGIALVGDKLYIADSFNHRIRVANLASP